MALQGASNVTRDASGNITFTPINGRQVRGIAGEFSDDSPKSARQYIVVGSATFGKLFSLTEKALDKNASSEKSVVAVQGVTDGSYAMGILVNPKEHFTNGFVTTLQPGQYALNTNPASNGTAATIATRGHIWVMAKTATVAGAPVYVNTDGDLGNSTLGTELKGAKWLTTAAAGKLAEVAIDMPTIASDDEGSGSL